jgi:hydrogenase-4 component B
VTGIALILVAAGILACSGVPGLFGSRRSQGGEVAAAIAMSLGAAIGLIGVAWPSVGAAPVVDVESGLPWGRLTLGVDAISRVFLVPVLLVPALGAIYGLGYWRQREHRGNGRKLRLFYGVMPAAMVLILLARDGVLFLLAWEAMALAAFFLVSTEDEKPECRAAGWVYFIATHVGTLCLFAMFALLRRATGSFALSAAGLGHAPPALANAVFVLGLIGFGLKAGFMPLHVWLPGAHANAPSHVSAVLSGVMLKIGIYGIVRITAGVAGVAPAWWGATLVTVGSVSAIGGIVFAVGQKDMKRLLAYSSIENIGIIGIGLGVALLGRAAGEGVWAALGLGGALFHVWNHSLFKPLLFFGAGSVIHGTGTRPIDLLGGLLRRMPRTGVLFLTGSAAICALPPLNGFASELMIYLGLLRTSAAHASASWAGGVGMPVLALVGALAAAAFAKLFGAVFLGQARSAPAEHAHESPPIMLAPMAALGGLCVLVGIVPVLAAGPIDSAIAAWWNGAGSASIVELAPLRVLSITGVALLGGGIAAWALVRRAVGPRSAPRPGTWACGYAAPSPRMQYTGSSFGQGLVSLFSWALRPRVRRATVRGLFPSTDRFESEVPDTVLDRGVVPVLRLAGDFLRRVGLLQQGRIQLYVLYVVLMVLVLFVATFAL